MRISDWSSDVCSSDLGSSPPCCEGADHASGRLMLKGRHAAIRPAAATRAAFDFTMLLLENAAMAQLCEILPPNPALSRRGEIGRAQCRERVCQYVSISVVAVSLQKKIRQKNIK